jgi:hypothetical protein
MLQRNFVIDKGRTSFQVVKYWRIKLAWKVVNTQDEQIAYNTFTG